MRMWFCEFVAKGRFTTSMLYILAFNKVPTLRKKEKRKRICRHKAVGSDRPQTMKKPISTKHKLFFPVSSTVQITVLVLHWSHWVIQETPAQSRCSLHSLLQKHLLLTNPVKACSQHEAGISVSSKTTSTCNVISALVSDFGCSAEIALCLVLTSHSLLVWKKRELGHGSGVHNSLYVSVDCFDTRSNFDVRGDLQKQVLMPLTAASEIILGKSHPSGHFVLNILRQSWVWEY